MPLASDVLPDPSRHRICRRCRKWFEPDEGALVAPEMTSPLGMLHWFRTEMVGDESLRRFQCHNCSRARRRTAALLLAALAAVIAVASVLKLLGLIQR